MVQHLYFLFQLVSSFKKWQFGFETACFDGRLLYAAEFEVLKFPVQNILHNLVQKHRKTVYIFFQ